MIVERNDRLTKWGAVEAGGGPSALELIRRAERLAQQFLLVVRKILLNVGVVQALLALRRRQTAQILNLASNGVLTLRGQLLKRLEALLKLCSLLRRKALIALEARLDLLPPLRRQFRQLLLALLWGHLREAVQLAGRVPRGPLRTLWRSPGHRRRGFPSLRLQRRHHAAGYAHKQGSRDRKGANAHDQSGLVDAWVNGINMSRSSSVFSTCSMSTFSARICGELSGTPAVRTQSPRASTAHAAATVNAGFQYVYGTAGRENL